MESRKALLARGRSREESAGSQLALQDGVELVHPEKKVVENIVFQNYFFYARAGTKLFVFSPCLQMELAWSMVHIQST